MADGDVLKEFLVSLGWSIKESEHKKFQYALRLSTEEVTKLGLAITGVSTALAAGMQRIADQFQTLYYTSQLTGATVQNLRDLQFAANQVGVSGDVMIQSLRQVHVMLQSPGGEAMIRAFAGYKGQITSSDQALQILLEHWKYLYDHNMAWLARQQEAVMGFNSAALEPYILNLARANAAIAEHARRWASIDQGKLSRDAVELGNAWRNLSDEILYWPTLFTSRFIEPLTTGVKWLSDEMATLRKEFLTQSITVQDWELGLGGIVAVAGGWKASSLVFRSVFSMLTGGFRQVGVAATEASAAETAALNASKIGGLRTILTLFTAIEAARAVSQATPEDVTPGSPAAKKKADEFWDRWFGWTGIKHGGEEHPGLFSHLFHKQSYQVPGGGGNPLLHLASYETPTQGGTGYGAAGDLQSWLHGSTAFVPSVRIIDATGIFGTPGSAGGGGAGGFGGGGSGYGGGVGSLSSAGPVGRVPVNKLDAIRRLYLHARTPVSAGGLGLDQAHTMALLGNAYAESGLDPMASGDHGTSKGLFQWHNDRWAALQQSLGKRASDPLAQFDYAVKEQMKRDPGWFTRQGNLTNEFEHGFERPSHETDRTPYADAINRALGAMTGTALGGVHHHGDKNVTINQGDMHVTVHGNAGDAVGPMRTAHSRVLGDAVRNLAPVIA